MQYTSTRDNAVSVASSCAILSGISAEGGLFLPRILPRISMESITALGGLPYSGRAAAILGLFLEDFTAEELISYASAAYSKARFTADTPAPVVGIGGGRHVLELFHGPTCAFKDFALQILPYLLTASARKNGSEEEIIILVATSGDTGKAALEGFADVEGTGICVFYPKGGTSRIQQLQMTTQAGSNVLVTAVEGNFDDAQAGVKAIFTDKEYAAELKAAGKRLSSANSINWGRLAPQVAYYFSAYCDLVNSGEIRPGEAINIAVPTGNFGNILAAYIAGGCGLPVKRFICASNSNNVLTDFIRTGVYDRNRPFYITTSPSMDILVSSNLERLLYMLTGGDDAEIRGYMAGLAGEGRYEVAPDLHRAIAERFACGFADDAMAAEAIKGLYNDTGYLADPHTAVAIRVYDDYRAETGDDTPVVIASTASPFKFPGSVLKALGQPTEGGEFELLRRIEGLAGRDIPPRLKALEGMAERFTGAIAPAAMKGCVSGFAGLR